MENEENREVLAASGRHRRKKKGENGRQRLCAGISSCTAAENGAIFELGSHKGHISFMAGSHLSGRNDAELSELAGWFNVLVIFSPL